MFWEYQLDNCIVQEIYDVNMFVILMNQHAFASFDFQKALFLFLGYTFQDLNLLMQQQIERENQKNMTVHQVHKQLGRMTKFIFEKLSFWVSPTSNSVRDSEEWSNLGN